MTPSTPFTVAMRVRLADVDAQQHLTSAAYLQYANQAHWEHVTAAGVDVPAMIGAGFGPALLETNIRFQRELRAGDDITVDTMLRFGDRKTYEIHCELRGPDGEVAATITSTAGMLDLESRRLIGDPAAHWARFAAERAILGLDR